MSLQYIFLNMSLHFLNFLKLYLKFKLSEISGFINVETAFNKLSNFE